MQFVNMKYDRDYLCVNKSQFVPVIFEPPCTSVSDGGRMRTVRHFTILRVLINARLKKNRRLH
jgi:hypothetical protein